MTVSEAITVALRRVGLDTNTTDYREQMLTYVNATIADIESRAFGAWWFRFKSGTLSTVNGTASYELAADVMRPLSFRDTTNGRTIAFIDSEEADALDPDSDETGTPRAVYLAGVDSDTGNMVVAFEPIPDGVVSIAYRYYSQAAELASYSDTGDLCTDYGIPTWMHPAIYFGAAKLYLSEEQDAEASMLQATEYERIIRQALGINGRMRGNQELRMGRAPGARGAYGNATYYPSDGSLH